MARAVPRAWCSPVPSGLAGATGHPILPFHIESRRHWTLGSWDGTQIPKPFSTVGVAIGPPIHVPEIGEDNGRIEQVRELESALKGLEERAARLAGDAPAGR